MSEIIKDLAADVANELAVDGEVAKAEAMDPATILTIIEIIQLVVARLKECRKTPEEAVAMARRPTLLANARVRAAVREKTPRKPIWYRLKLAAAVVRSGARLSADRVGEIYASTPPAGEPAKQEE